MARATLLLVVLIFVAAAPAPASGFDDSFCQNVAPILSPCSAYLRGHVLAPDRGCCTGIVLLQRKATEIPLVAKAICKCLKHVAHAMHDVLPSTQQALPSACGVNSSSASWTHCKGFY